MLKGREKIDKWRAFVYVVLLAAVAWSIYDTRLGGPTDDRIERLEGPRGPAGELGATGKQGIPGKVRVERDSRGNPRIVGADEAPVDGINGRNGTDGTNGRDGARGPAGPSRPGNTGPRGPAGPRGPRGPAGLPGQDGVSPSIEAIVQEVLRRLRSLP